MALGAWTVGVFLNFTTNGPVTMQRLASNTAMANAQLQKQLGLINSNALAMQRYRARMDELWMSAQRFGTRVAGFSALAGGAAIAYSLKQAGELQNAMIGVASTTHATAAQYASLQGLVIQQSGILAQSTTTLARELQTVAQTAFPRTADLSRMFPLIARYADDRMMTSGEDPIAAATGAAQLAHLMQAFKPGAMSTMLDQLMQMQMVTHATTSQLVTQGKYFMPSAVAAGVSTSDIMDQLTLMAQGGFMSGRGGTALKNIILAASSAPLITSFATAIRYGQMHALGLTGADNRLLPQFRNASGGLMLDAFELHLNAMRHRMSQADYQRAITSSFGQGATPFLMFATSDAAIHQLQITRQARNLVGGVMDVWNKFQNGFLYQWRTFTTNLQNTFTALGLPWLGSATNNLKAINTFLANLNNTLTAHPQMARALGIVIGAFTTLAAIRFTIGTASLLIRGAQALGMLPVVGAGIGGFFRLLDVIFTGGMIGGIAGGAMRLGGAVMALGRTFALASVVSMPATLQSLALLLGPVAAGLAVLLGVILANPIPAAPELKLRAGASGYGTKSFWLNYLHRYGAKAVPKTILDQLIQQHAYNPKGGGGHVTHHTTINKLEVHSNYADPKKVAMAIRDLLRNPRSTMYSADSKTRTHPFIPRPLSTPPAVAFG